MHTTTFKSALCASSLALLSLSCSSEPELPAESQPTNEDVASAPPRQLVPPFEGPYDAMWGELRGLDTVSQPISSEAAKLILDGSGGTEGVVSAAETPQPMIINLGTPEELSLWSVAYTDSGLVKPETYSIVRPPREALVDALYNEHVVGLAFNPFTKVSREQVFSFNVDKLYIAGLIGYLTTKDAEPGRQCLAAAAAYAERKPFETLHHALRALDDEGEDWSQCELAKLWAMWELDFPGSREMALEELEWFIETKSDTPEARAMLETFRAAAR